VKAFRLVLSSNGEAASDLHFLDRSDASRYQKILLWPWLSLGYFQAESGEKFPLAGLQFRVEPVILPGIHEPELDWVVWRKDGLLGSCPIVPGRCFDPSSWRPISDHDRRDPIIAPKIAHAERELDESQK
jgi:hypothetical protein